MSPMEAVLTNSVVMTGGEKILLASGPFAKPRVKSFTPDGRQMIVLVSVKFVDPTGNSTHMPKRDLSTNRFSLANGH
jgi:hypothetical protein